MKSHHTKSLFFLLAVCVFEKPKSVPWSECKVGWIQRENKSFQKLFKKKVSPLLAVDTVEVLSAVDVYRILANIDKMNYFPGERSQEQIIEAGQREGSWRMPPRENVV